MLLTDGENTFRDGVFDIDYQNRAGWAAMGPVATKIIGIGDRLSGPIFVLFASDPSGEVNDLAAAKAHGFVHAHRSDTMRLNIVGDHIMGRDCYGPGDIRLQEANAYYGPESSGPLVLSGEVGLQHLLCFADRRGYRVRGINPKDDAKIETIEAYLEPAYRRVVSDPLDGDIKGVTHIRLNLEKRARGGHIDFRVEDSEGWQRVGNNRLAIVELGDPETGPVHAVIDAPAGAIITGAITLETDSAYFVIAGSCRTNTTDMALGHTRVVEAGRPHPAVIAGADGAKLLVTVADRSAILGAVMNDATMRAVQSFVAAGRIEEAA